MYKYPNRFILTMLYLSVRESYVQTILSTFIPICIIIAKSKYRVFKNEHTFKPLVGIKASKDRNSSLSDSPELHAQGNTINSANRTRNIV